MNNPKEEGWREKQHSAIADDLMTDVGIAIQCLPVLKRQNTIIQLLS